MGASRASNGIDIATSSTNDTTDGRRRYSYLLDTICRTGRSKIRKTLSISRANVQLAIKSLHFKDTYLRTTSFHSSSARLLVCLLPLEALLPLPIAAMLLVLEKETVLETLDAVIIVLLS